MKTIHELEQGSDSWHAFRSQHFGASEAAACLGISKYQTRTELLRRKATGIEPEVSPQLQAVFDRGHATEIGGRAIAQSIIGQELYPVTVSEGKLSASCDGLTMLEDIAFEHKQHNATLADSVRAGKLPEEHQPQCQQVMMLTGADKLLFMVSDGTNDNCAWMWVEPDKEWCKVLLQAWTQFAIDLEAYEHVEQTVAPVAAPIEALPALAVTVTGSISLTHNLERFGQRLSAFVQGLNAKPETDQDFADLDAAVKVLKEAETALDSAEKNALAQTTTIADMCGLVEMYRKVARDNRLMFEKIVKAEKENRRAEIVRDAQDSMVKHIEKLNARIGGKFMPSWSMQIFNDAIRGLKSLESMREKIGNAVRAEMFAANDVADTIEANIKAIPESWKFLFSDMAQICTKNGEDFARLAESRIAAHKAAEAEKAAAAKKAEDTRVAAAVEAERKAGEARAAEAVEAERKAEAKRAAEAARPAALDLSKPAGTVIPPQSVALAPEEKRAAVVDAQDDIAAFMNSRDFGKEPSKIRAILVEFVKFTAERSLKVAA